MEQSHVALANTPEVNSQTVQDGGIGIQLDVPHRIPVWPVVFLVFSIAAIWLRFEIRLNTGDEVTHEVKGQVVEIKTGLKDLGTKVEKYHDGQVTFEQSVTGSLSRIEQYNRDMHKLQ